MWAILFVSSFTFELAKGADDLEIEVFLGKPGKSNSKHLMTLFVYRSRNERELAFKEEFNIKA